MTPKQQRFVEEYLIDLNATQAAIRAGYSKKTADQQASRLLTNVKVKAAIETAMEARSKRTEFDADWVLKRLGAEAMADVADLYEEDGRIKPIHEWPLIFRQGLVAGFDIDEHLVGDAKVGQTTKIKLSDRIKRIELIGKHVDVQAFSEKQQIDHTIDEKPTTDVELARRLLFLLDKGSRDKAAEGKTE
jgi:phage terminase small subunit